MATVRGMTPEAIRALLKREVGDYNATLSVANQALSNSMAIGDAISDLDKQLKNLPDTLKEGNLDLDKLKGDLSNLQKDLAGNREELSTLQDDLKKKEELIKSIQDEIPEESLYVPGNLVNNPEFKTDENGVVLHWGKYVGDTRYLERFTKQSSESNKGSVVIAPKKGIVVDEGYGFTVSKGQVFAISVEVNESVPPGKLSFFLHKNVDHIAHATNWRTIRPGEPYLFTNELYVLSDKFPSSVLTDVRLGIINDTSAPITISRLSLQEVTGEWSLQDGVVNVNKIADKAVSTAKIIDNAIVAEKIAANAVIADKIAADAVTTNKLAADAVTAEKIAANAVTTNKLSANAVVADKIASNAITSDKIAANAVVADKIAARSIGVQKLLVSAGNLFPDPDFLDPTWGRFSTSEGLRITANGTQTGTYYSPDGITSYTSILLEPNAVYRLTLNLRFEASAPLSKMDVYVRYRDANGGRKILLVGSFTKDSTNEGQYSDSSVLITMPSDMKDGRCELGFFVQKNMPSGSVDIRSVRLLRATDSAMVVEGAIKADHLSAGSVTTKALSAGAITADKIASNAITANHIQANAITAKELRAEVFTQVGTNILPRVPGTDLPAWTAHTSGSKYPVKSKDESVYPGFVYYIFDTTYTTNYSNRVVVDPTVEYEFTIWLKSREKSTLYIELRDQDSNHAVASGGINNSAPDSLQTGTKYLVQGLVVPDVWTQYKTKITLNPNVRSVYVASIYGSHPSGAKGSVLIGEDMSLRQSQIPQAEIDRRQDDNFVLHENQLKWLRWTKTIFDQAFPGKTEGNWPKSITTGLIDLVANYTDKNTGLRIIKRPGWSGKYLIAYTLLGGGEPDTISGYSTNPKNASDSIYLLDKSVYHMRMTIYPDHSPEPREWVFKVVFGSIKPNNGYSDVKIKADGSFSFNCSVVANADVEVAGRHKLKQGTLIPPFMGILSSDSVNNGIIVFTEKKPPLQYEIGAPESGKYSFSGGKVRVPKGEWTELTSWEAPDWIDGKNIAAAIAYRVGWNWWNVLAIGVKYGARIRLNNKVIYENIIYAGNATTENMAMAQTIKVNRSDGDVNPLTLKKGDVVTLEAFANPNAAFERDVLYSNLGIAWGAESNKI